MINLSRATKSRIKKEYPQINVADLKARPIELYRDGSLGMCLVYVGKIYSSSEMTITRLYFDIDRNEVDSGKYREQFYGWYSETSEWLGIGKKNSKPTLDKDYHHPIPDDACLWRDGNKHQMNNLEDELVLLTCLGERYATEKEFDRILIFRNEMTDVRGISLKRFDCLIGVEELIPESYNGLKSDSQFELFEEKIYPNFVKAMEYVYDVLPPKGHPPLRVRKDWKKAIHEVVLKHWDDNKINSWTDGNRENLLKWLALKYTFKGLNKTPSQIKNSYSTWFARNNPKEFGKF